MGWYVSIIEKENKKVLVEKEYSLGYLLLMFDTQDNAFVNSPVFETDGKTAHKTIDSYISLIKNGKNAENSFSLTKIERELIALKSSIDENKTYVANYTEAMFAIYNPEFNPRYFIDEIKEKLIDTINGYQDLATKDIRCEQLLHFIDNLSTEIRAKIVYLNNNDIIAIGIGVFPNDEDRKIIKERSVSENNTGYLHRYLERKLFYILKDSGLKFSLCCKGNNMFYAIFTTNEIDKWLSSKPYVDCSFSPNFYDIPFMVLNTPAEKEKFYCYASWKSDITSIIIDGTELVGASSDTIEKVIGKPLHRVCYEQSEIKMFIKHEQ